jgi:PAS domain S-box-containing protein
MTGAEKDRNTQHDHRWKPWLFALLAGVLMLAAEQAVERYQQRSVLGHQRGHIISELSQLRARLESVINGNLWVIQGLTAVISAQPDIDQTAFARIARGLINESRALRNVAGAPDLIVSLMHPIEGNEAAIGLDYRQHAGQRDAALRAAETGAPVIAGPVRLVQGGMALIAREPVFLPSDRPDGQPRFWGLVSAVIDIDRLYRLAGLDKMDDGLSLAIRGKDGLGPQGEVFFGNPEVFTGDPLTVSVNLPGGSWQLAALPAEGWEHLHHDAELLAIRLVGLVVGLLIATMTYLTMRKHFELREAMDKLGESQTLFEGFMHHLPAGAFVRSPNDGTPLFENRWLLENLHTADRGCGIETAHDLEVIKTGSKMLQRQLRDPRGEAMYCDTLRFVLRRASRHPLVGGIVMDVTERVRTEQDLATNRARLQTLLDTIPDLVWLKDPDGIYLACNRRFEDLFGAKEEAIIGRRDQDFVDADLAEHFRQHDLAAMRAGQPTVNEETVTFANDGHQALLETIKAPVQDKQGNLTGVLGIARDITERQRTEEALRASAFRLTMAERIGHIGHWEQRVEDDRMIWSDETYRIFGLAPQQQSIDLDWVVSRIHPDDREQYQRYMAGLLASRRGDPAPGLLCRIIRVDDEERVLSLRVSIDYGHDGEPTRLFGTAQDVTEREMMHRDLQARIEELTRWQLVMLGREDRVQQLKSEVNRLLDEYGLPPRYANQVKAP